MKNKIFLGGSVSSSWRKKLIPIITVDYFNPIVDDWNEGAIREEDRQKLMECNIHLYVVTPETKGFYWAAETMESLLSYKRSPDSKGRSKQTILAFLEWIDGNKFSGDGFMRSAKAIEGKVKKYGGIVVHDILELAKVLNEMEEKE